MSTSAHKPRPAGSTPADGDVSDASVPARGGQPCPPRIAPANLSIAETGRLARQHTTGLITRARLAFALRSSLRGLHQAIAPRHHYSARLLAAGPGNQLREEGGARYRLSFRRRRPGGWFDAGSPPKPAPR